MEMEYAADDPEAYYALDTAFHVCIVKCTQNKILMQVLNAIRDVVAMQQKQFVTIVPDHNVTANRYHRDILDAISKQKPALASKAMMAHLREVERVLVQLCRRKEVAAALAPWT